jgi:ADP-ribosylglycohydrolase
MKPLERIQLSLTGLSVGDALGEPFFGAGSALVSRIERCEVPPAPWRYTDDTEMALFIVETLWRYGRIEPDALTEGFSRRYNPRRGYGAGAHRHDFMCDRASARACFLAFPVRFRSP